MNIYFQGLTMGLAYVAPIGLQNLFVINTALTQKRSRAYVTALIVIFFDVTLGLACFLGAGALMQALPWLQKVILAVGSAIVIYIGVGLLRARASLQGGRDVNVRAYLSRFNFTGVDQEKKCGVLSGGERNRLQLAIALKQEGNVLLLDEPTNDIDVNTLRALEEGLESFAGCAVTLL